MCVYTSPTVVIPSFFSLFLHGNGYSLFLHLFRLHFTLLTVHSLSCHSPLLSWLSLFISWLSQSCLSLCIVLYIVTLSFLPASILSFYLYFPCFRSLFLIFPSVRLSSVLIHPCFLLLLLYFIFIPFHPSLIFHTISPPHASPLRSLHFKLFPFILSLYIASPLPLINIFLPFLLYFPSASLLLFLLLFTHLFLQDSKLFLLHHLFPFSFTFSPLSPALQISSSLSVLNLFSLCFLLHFLHLLLLLFNRLRQQAPTFKINNLATVVGNPFTYLAR